MDTRVVIGLGNPGWEYENTRHNVGFRVIDELCRRLGRTPVPGRGEFLFARAQGDGGEVVLIKPLTYMNNSGLAAVEALEQFGSATDGLLVISDDFALPLGTLRLRAGGSDGGHNGLYSIIYHLGTDQFARLRCGIGTESMPGKSEKADFVLSQFDEDELETAAAMIRKAADAVDECLSSGITRAMNSINST